MIKTKLSVLLFLVFSFVSTAFSGQTVLHMQSEPGDYIGMGQGWFYDAQDVSFNAMINYSNGVSISLFKHEYPRFISWDLQFSEASEQLLSPGLYVNAMRFPFNSGQGLHGLSVSGMGRACDTLAGEFNVLEIVYGENGTILKFAADFTQKCELYMPPLYGSVRINSDIPISGMQPPRIELNNVMNTHGCVEATSPEGAKIELIGSSGQDDGSFIYSWISDSGISEVGKIFNFDLAVDESIGVSLTILNPTTNEEITASKIVCVSDTTPPLINIINPIQGETYVGNNIRIDVVVSDIVDKNIENYDVFVGNTGQFLLDQNGTGSTLLFKPELNGSGYIKTITVTATDASGNKFTESVNINVEHDMRP